MIVFDANKKLKNQKEKKEITKILKGTDANIFLFIEHNECKRVRGATKFQGLRFSDL
jgi:hypothetical protein